MAIEELRALATRALAACCDECWAKLREQLARLQERPSVSRAGNAPCRVTRLAPALGHPGWPGPPRLQAPAGLPSRPMIRTTWLRLFWERQTP